MKKIKHLLILILLAGIVYVTYPDSVQQDLDYFKHTHNAEVVFFMKITDYELKLSRLSGPDLSRKMWERRYMEGGNTLLDAMRYPSPACIVAQTQSVSDPVYKEYLEEIGVKFITICPVGDNGMLGAGFSESPKLSVLPEQKELAKVIEYKIWN